MHSRGIFAGRNDIFSELFRGTINAALRSRVASACLLVVMMFLATALLWNAGVDHYVISNGKRVTVPVVDEKWNSKSGYLTHYRYPGAGHGNPLHFFDSFFVDQKRGSDIGIANTYGTKSSCRPGSATVTVAYLPNDPRIHTVVEDRSAFLFLMIGTLCVFLSGALIWNLSRLGNDQPSLILPGWPEPQGV